VNRVHTFGERKAKWTLTAAAGKRVKGVAAVGSWEIRGNFSKEVSGLLGLLADG